MAVRLSSYDLSLLPVLLIAMASVADSFVCVLQVVQFACCLSSDGLDIALVVLSLRVCLGFRPFHSCTCNE